MSYDLQNRPIVIKFSDHPFFVISITLKNNEIHLLCRKTAMRKILLVLTVSLASLSLSAQDNSISIRTQHYNLEKGIALQGYDPVSYFVKNPLKGKKEFAHTYNGVQYLFSSNANLETFKKKPTGYEPAYGGWCAYAMGADGSKVEVDPETYKIIGGKLYLFYNFYFNNTLKKWNADEQKLNKSADINWQKTIIR
jgi:YHS domain-containing protein